MEVPRLGVKLELQLPAYTTATAMWDPSHICDLYHSSRQRGILNPLSQARDQTRILMDASRVRWVRHTGELRMKSFYVRKNYAKAFIYRSFHHGSSEMNLTSSHKDVGSIPSLSGLRIQCCRL